MIEKCPSCGSEDLIIGKQGNGYSKISITLFRGSNIEHIICADCGLIVQSRITNLELAKKSGKRITEQKKKTLYSSLFSII